jgi:dihydrofolate reductase
MVSSVDPNAAGDTEELRSQLAYARDHPEHHCRWLDRDAGDWFDPQGQGDVDNSDLLEELHRQDSEADGFLAGRRTFEDLRGYWPQLTDDPTGIRDYLNRVQKYVVSSTMTDPQW